MRVTEKMKKLLSILLCLCMLLQNAPVMAFAATTDNLCEHHPEHTAECHYAEAVAGVECAHECGEECAEGCVHTAHDDACGYVAAVEAHECHYECAECANNELSSRTSPQTGVAIPEGDAQNQEIATSAPDGDLLAMTEAVCDCGTDDPAIHATTCAQYVAPENPQCFCAEKCTEANVWCDVCGFDYSKCTGTDTAAAYADGDDLAISGAWMSSSTPYLASGSKEASAAQPETGGYAYWDAASNTLTLNNFTSSTDAATGIFYRGSAVTLRIVLVGNNSVTGGNGGGTEVKSGVGVNSDTDIIFSGGGTLTATGTGTSTGNGGGYGVFARGDITVDSGTTLIATGSSFQGGVLVEGGSIIVNGGSLTGNGGESGGNGVHASTGITVNGGSLIGNSEVSHGVYTPSGSISVSGDSHIVANGGSSGNVIPAGNLPEDYYYYASGDGTDKTFTHSADALLTGTVYQRYFELVTAQHLSDTYTSNGDATHSRYCSCEIPTKVIASEACSGGTATCTTPANCENCGASYGELNLTNHDENAEYENGFCLNCDAYQPAELVGTSYQITNAGQLYWFAQQVNSGNTAINGELTADIKVNDHVLTADGALNGDGSNYRAWTPIGSNTQQYTGTFDGNGKTVSGLYCHDTTTLLNVGLFSVVGEGGEVQNVGIADSYLCGFQNIGGVAGNNYGTVMGCYNTGTVSGNRYVGGVVGCSNDTVTNCYNTGTVGATGTDISYVGGVLGLNDGTATGCYNTGTVSGTEYVGGVVGSGVTVTNCYNTGAVSGTTAVGGVAGAGNGTVTGCYNTGTVSGTNYVGGVAGYNRGTVTGCYFDSTVYTGNAIGSNYATATDVEGKSTEQFKRGEVAYLLSQGENGSIWGQTIGTDPAPVFSDAKVYYGYTSCGDTAAVYTNNANVFPEKPEHTQNPTYTDNHDGTHSAVYPCCGTKGQPENHTLTYTANGSTITESCSANCGYSASLTLKAPANLVYDRTEKAATVEGEIIADYELTYSADAVIMAGDYTATLTVGDYSVSLAFTIAKADPDVVTPSDLKATYGQTLADVELPGGWAWKNSSASVGSVGSNTFAAIYTPANISNFNTLERDLTVVVAKAMPTVTAPVAADDLVYNGTARTLITAGTATGGTMQYSLDGTIWSETIPTGKDAKTYTVYYKVVGDSNHNDSSVDSVQVTIGKATLTVTADNKTMTTGQNLPTFTYTITGFVSGETEDVLTAKPTVVCVADGKTAGTYDITVSGAEADNYEITHVNGTLSVVDHQHAWTYTAEGDTITAICNAEDCPDAEQSITISAAGKTYDGTPVTANLTGSIDGVATPEITYTGNTNAGTHTASITIEGKTASMKFTIEKATVTVTADAKSKPYGTDNPALTYTSEGLLGDDVLTGALETTATKTSNVGEYDITVGSLANSNYTIDFVGAKLTITKAAAPEIQWPTAAALTYGQKLSDSALTSEDKNGTFAWQDGSIVPTVKNNGYVVVYTPKDTDNYDYTGVELTETIPVTVSKVSATVTVAPTPNTLTYTGEAQYLITAGEAEGGTMQYQLNGGAWSASIPTAKDEGTYTVSWKVVGDANHADTEVKSITVTIGECTHSGNTNVDDTDCTTQVTCSVCGDVLVEAKTHVWGDWTITKNPTTTEEGSRERLCTNDGCEAKDTGSIPMLNEVEVPEEIVGGDIEVSNPTPATGDDVTITVTPDTGKEVDEVIVTGKDGKEIPVTDNGDGTYTYEQPDGDVTVEVVIKDTIYTVTWIVDGKTYKETQHKYGETITAPTDPIKAQSGCTTYTFDKWNGFTSGMTMPVNESLAFTAVFTEGESHIDENTDHICDRNCGKTDIEDHADPSGDNDHVCDYCRQPVNECSDVATDKDHLCDECGAAMPKVGTEVMFSEEDTTGTITPGAPAEIDGKPIVIDWDGEIWLEDKGSKLLVTYKFNEDADPHKAYPTAMYAWLLKWEGDTCEAIRIPELDNFMTYKGTSIRVGHSSDGIRFFTAVPVDTLNQAMKGTLLTGELEGYKLVELGTLYKWAATGTELTVANGAKSYVYGGSAGSNYRQFSKEGSLSWFTGMLTELPGDAATLAKDILSRPYAVFENADGDQITLYGGSIQRSIYYVAQQNKDTWASGTAYDNYVEKIISTVEAAKG